MEVAKPDRCHRKATPVSHHNPQSLKSQRGRSLRKTAYRTEKYHPFAGEVCSTVLAVLEDIEELRVVLDQLESARSQGGSSTVELYQAAHCRFRTVCTVFPRYSTVNEVCAVALLPSLSPGTWQLDWRNFELQITAQYEIKLQRSCPCPPFFQEIFVEGHGFEDAWDPLYWYSTV